MQARLIIADFRSQNFSLRRWGSSAILVWEGGSRRRNLKSFWNHSVSNSVLREREKIGSHFRYWLRTVPLYPHWRIKKRLNKTKKAMQMFCFVLNKYSWIKVKFFFSLHVDQRSFKQLPLFFFSLSERMSYFSITEIVKSLFLFLSHPQFLIVVCKARIVYTFQRLWSVSSLVITPGYRRIWAGGLLSYPRSARSSIFVSSSFCFLNNCFYF